MDAVQRKAGAARCRGTARARRQQANRSRATARRGNGCAGGRISAGRQRWNGFGPRGEPREPRGAGAAFARAARRISPWPRRELRLVNGMLEACRGGETFATMDLCVAELDSGEVNFEKLSACPSYLLRGGRCRRIGGERAAAGNRRGGDAAQDVGAAAAGRPAADGDRRRGGRLSAATTRPSCARWAAWRRAMGRPIRGRWPIRFCSARCSE